MINGPCQYCVERKPLCHSTCVKYISFKEDLEKAKAKAQKERQLNEFNVCSHQRIEKLTRGTFKC